MSDDDLPNRWGFLGESPDDANNDPNRKNSQPPPEQPDYKPQRKRKKKSAFVRFIILPIFFLGVLFAIVAIASAIYFHWHALTYDLADLKKVPERTLVYDRNGGLMGHVSGHGANRLIVPVSQVSQDFIEPLLAREDTRFYEHGGVDYVGVLRAAVTNFRSGGMDQGASTLTMQLARNSFGLTDKSLVRKAKEVALSNRLERKLEKNEILEYYVNRVYFGAGLYGIEKAAQGFFMKPASELTLGEGAMLAGVIRGPSLLNPFRNIDGALAVRDETLVRMVASGKITQVQADEAKQIPIKLRPLEKRFSQGSYVLQEIHDFLDRSLGEEQVKQGGLRVFCTIDSALQKAAEEGLDGHLRKLEARSGWAHPKRSNHKGKDSRFTTYVQGAVVSIDNKNGAILAYVGGRSYKESPFNRAVNAERQAGSTFKPFIYAAAFDKPMINSPPDTNPRLLPGTWVSDGPISYRQENGRIWNPKNYDGTYQGDKPSAWGLIKSRNTMSIRVGDRAGMDNIQKLAKALYLDGLPKTPVAYLGAFETTPMNMTSAYSTFPTGGLNFAPHMIERIENASGQVLFQNDPKPQRIFSESVAWMTSDVLAKVFTEGTARSAGSTYGYKTIAHGKTGTTNDNKDGWFIGYTDKVTTGVWVGMDTPKTVMYKGTGSSLALPVWTTVMKAADVNGYQGEAIEPPAGTQLTNVCRVCGLRASRRTTDEERYQMLIPPRLMPTGSCVGHTDTSIFTKSPDWYKSQQVDGIPKARPVKDRPILKAWRSMTDFFKGR